MPRRGNPFQSLVRALHQQAPSGAQVRESVELQDRVTGQLREVDVVIELDVRGHPVVVSIECVDRKRPAGVPWVDQMIEKHTDLSTNKLVLVSASGFTDPAIRKADAKGVETEALQGLVDRPWTKIVGKKDQLLLESVRAHVGIAVLRSSEDEWPGARLSLGDRLVRGDLSVPVARFVDAVLSKQELMEVALRIAGEAEGNGSTMVFDPSPGMVAATFEGETIDVHNLIAVVLPSVTHETVDLESGMLGDAPVAYGGLRGPGGRELDIAVIESEEEGPQVFFTERSPGQEPRTGSLAEYLISHLEPATGSDIRRLLAKGE